MSVIFSPHDYQLALISHGLELKRSAFFAGMGTGKTVSAASVAAMRIWLGQAEKVLIIAPKLVARSVWPEEVNKWDHLSGLVVSVIQGDAYNRHRALHANADIYTINYENIPWLIKTVGDKWPFNFVICDESTKIKSFRTKQGGQRAQALAYIAPKTPYWLNLTGTPTPNGLVDLWGQSWFLDGGRRLGKTFEDFKTRWFSHDFEARVMRPNKYAFSEITDLLSDLCISIEAKDFLDLPPLIEKNIYIDLPKKARVHYEQMEDDFFTVLQSDPVRALNTAAAYGKCLQISSGAVYTNPDDIAELGKWELLHDEKLDALEDVIEEAAGMPVLVSYYFKHDLARLKKRFPQGIALDGKTETINAFNAGKIPIMFIHPKSAGHGLNLQHGSNIIVFFSNDWNLEEYQQVIERIGPTRQAQSGYKRPVYVIHIAARDTLEETVLQRRISKASVQSAIMERMKTKKGFAA